MTVSTQASDVRPVLFVYAHPDDEAICASGTMAALRQRGIPVTLIMATRGEAGQINEAAVATRETLGEVREGELRAAMAAVDVSDVRFLGYRDSGMEGTAENEDPRAFVQAPASDVVAKLVSIIQELRPSAVVTFGPDGYYGHPDHLYAYRTTTDAVYAAAEAIPAWQVPALYYSTTSRERMQERARHRRGPFAKMSPERLAKVGTPRSEITTVLDVSAFYPLKDKAMQAHLTQFGPDGPMRELSREEVKEWMSKEHSVRAPLPWDGAEPTGDDHISRLVAEFGTTPS